MFGREPQIHYNIVQIKKFAVSEIRTSGSKWFEMYFNFEHQLFINPFESHEISHRIENRIDSFAYISVDSLNRVELVAEEDEMTTTSRYRIKISDLTDEERKDIFDTIQTACDILLL